MSYAERIQGFAARTTERSRETVSRFSAETEEALRELSSLALLDPTAPDSSACLEDALAVQAVEDEAEARMLERIAAVSRKVRGE